MSQLTFQSHCSACKVTSAHWARANVSTHSKLDPSSPGKPYPIPPTFGTESHPYARQIGETKIMTVPEPEVPQNKVWIQPEYNIVVKKNADLDYVKELVANIVPPGSSPEDAAPMPPRPNVPMPPGVPPRYRLSGLKMGGAIPPPRPYVPTPPYERLLGFNSEDALPTPRPNVPLPLDAPPNQSLSSGFQTEDALPTPRPNVPLPPDAPPNQSLSGFNLPTPRPNVPLPPDAPPNQSLYSGFQTEDALPTPRPNVPLPPDAPPNR